MAGVLTIKESGGGTSTVIVGSTVTALTSSQTVPWSFLQTSAPFRVVGPANADYPGTAAVNTGSNAAIGAALNACLQAGFSARIPPGTWDIDQAISLATGSLANGRPTIVGASVYDTVLKPVPSLSANGSAYIGSFGQGHFSFGRFSDFRVDCSKINANPAPTATITSNTSGLVTIENSTSSIVYYTVTVTGGSITALNYLPSTGSSFWGSGPGLTSNSVLISILNEAYPMMPGDILTVSFTGTLNATAQFANNPFDFTTDSWRIGQESSSAMYFARVVITGTSANVGPLIAGRPCSVTSDGTEDAVFEAVRQLSVGYWSNRMYNGTAVFKDSVVYGLIVCGVQYRLRDTTTLAGGVYLSGGGANGVETYLLDGWFDNGIDGVWETYPITDNVTTLHNVICMGASFSGGQVATSAVVGGTGVGNGAYSINGQLAFGSLTASSPFFATSPRVLHGSMVWASSGGHSDASLLSNVTTGELSVVRGTNAARLYVLPDTLSSANLTAYGAPFVVGMDNRVAVTIPDVGVATLTVTAATGAVYMAANRLYLTGYTSGAASYVLTWFENGSGRTATITTAGGGNSYVNGGPIIMRPLGGSTITGQLQGTFVSSVTVDCVVMRVA